jgi:signal transduction histidine kinase
VSTASANKTSSFFRLSLLLASLFALASLLMAGALYVSVTRNVRERLHEDIRTDALDLASLASHFGASALRSEIEQRVDLHTPLPRWYALFAPDGQRLAGNLAWRPPGPGWWHRPFRARPSPTGHLAPVHTLTLLALGTAQGDLLVVGRDRTYINELEASYGRAFVGVLLLTVGIALALGALIGRRMLRRVSAMSDSAAAISSGQLSRRMPVRGNGDEFDRIAQTVNDMLKRIETLLGEVRRIGADIAHDLRTPLTHLRRRLESARAHPPATTAELDGLLEDALREIDELLVIFQALLRIARVESGEARAGFVAIDLGTLLTELADAYLPVAEAEGHHLDLNLQPNIAVQGDRELLVQAFVNLIENAIRHTSQGTRIQLKIERVGQGVVASIADNGPGIPLAERDDVLQPFRRLDRSRHTPGNGLGLALVRAVAELHDADLTLTDNAPGLCISLHFALDR